MRGEYLTCICPSLMIGGSPPLARGIPLSTLSYRWLKWDHPRLRGEYFLSIPINGINGGSPPLARGIPYIWTARHDLSGITPACAGNTSRPSFCSGGKRDHPRLRGEYSLIGPNSWERLGSPPLARGILPFESYKQPQTRITPACAGNTFPQPHLLVRHRDHPRLRGEYTKKIPYLQPFPDLHL